MSYVKPELMIVTVVLYFLGMWLKQSQAVKDKYIPLILGAVGILICGLWVFSTCRCEGVQSFLQEIFAAVTQGILVAGLSTYVNQLIKQAGKKE